jgi:hypothetical protein
MASKSFTSGSTQFHKLCPPLIEVLDDEDIPAGESRSSTNLGTPAYVLLPAWQSAEKQRPQRYGGQFNDPTLPAVRHAILEFVAQPPNAALPALPGFATSRGVSNLPSETITLELGREGKFSAKARGCGAVVIKRASRSKSASRTGTGAR